MAESQGFTSAPSNPGATDGRFLDHLSSAAEMVGARRFREAEVEVLRGLSITPSDLRALKLLALVRFKLGRLEEARAVCREIVATVPRDAGVRLKLGLIALKLERIEEAVHELELATRLAPDDLRAWNYLGFAYARRGDRTRAAAAFRRAGQETLASQAEQAHATSSNGNPAAATHTRVDGNGSGPVSAVRGSESAQRPPTGSGALSSLDAAFDLSAPLDVREPRTDSDRLFSAARNGTGSIPVSPLIGYAVSHLAPPNDQSAWVGGTARWALGEGVFVRDDAAVACTGGPQWETANRRVRGRITSERLGADDHPFFRVHSGGEIFIGAPFGRLVPLRLEDDILYIRQDRVLAFEANLSWEHGQIPRAGLQILQFRGRGLVAIGVHNEPGVVKVTPDQPVFASSHHLLGWIGRVVARGAGQASSTSAGPSPSEGAPFGITCEGEGVVLLDVTGGRSS
jgi:uncharacterized protein (AIM24 family)